MQLHVYAYLAALLCFTSNCATAAIAVCEEVQVDETQACFKGLEFPPENSDKETICKYVESGMQCFDSACCTDDRYATAITQIQEQATTSGCTAVTCGSGVHLLPGLLTVSLGAMMAAYLV